MNTILIIIAGIIVLFLLAAAFTGKALDVERTVIINKPLPQVFEYVRQLKNHENFSVYAMMDPEMKKEYRGTDGQPGVVFAWDSSKSKNVGAGEQEIKAVHEGKSIDHELRFFRPMNDVANAKFTFEPAGNGTKVTWGFYSRVKFPMNVMKPMIANMLGKNQETGLQNLKKVMEKG